MTSRKDYVAVAGILKRTRAMLARCAGKCSASAMNVLTMDLAGYFARDNPRFSVGSFADASGMPPSAMRQDSANAAAEMTSEQRAHDAWISADDGEVLSAGCSHGR